MPPALGWDHMMEIPLWFYSSGGILCVRIFSSMKPFSQKKKPLSRRSLENKFPRFSHAYYHLLWNNEENSGKWTRVKIFDYGISNNKLIVQVEILSAEARRMKGWINNTTALTWVFPSKLVPVDSEIAVLASLEGRIIT